MKIRKSSNLTKWDKLSFSCAVVAASTAFSLPAKNSVANEAFAQNCKSISSDLERLACYDEAFKENNSKEQTGIRAKGKWLVTTGQSRLNDKVSISALLPSETKIKDLIGKEKHLVIIATCFDLKTTFSLSFDWYVPDTIVQYRFDDKPAGSVNMQKSQSGNSIGLWRDHQSIGFIEEMLQSKSLYIQLTPRNQNTIVADFDLNGVVEAMKPLGEACNWTL